MTISPLAPSAFPDLPEIGGVRLATVAAGIKYQGRDDVMMATLMPGTALAGVFTRSGTRSPSVLDCQDKIGRDSSAGAVILVNSGNANAFTGKPGSESVQAIASAVSTTCDVPAARVFTASTGVIGEPLPHARITQSLTALQNELSPSKLKEAAAAIMTTDTFAKGAGRTVTIDGKKVKIAGIAKGSGMIAPDMATMLAFVFTDGQIDRSELQALVSKLNAKTFNCITVDSDTSTSDTLLVAATGASGVAVGDNSVFEAALNDVLLDLAHQIVRDGEGASKFVTVQVTGADDDADAHQVAQSIANSPLVKTALAGEDANWGRVVMAVGKSGAKADRDSLSIRFGDITVAKNGWRAPEYSEEAASAYMKNDQITIGVDLGIGTGAATVWTCDLTHGYISINADYRS